LFWSGLCLVTGGGFFSAGLAVEGMYPMSELEQLDLRSAGLTIEPRAIYNPDGVSLVDGICKLGGCTGFFVSSQGLILTNHHCAFRAIRDASTPEQNYLANGFAAETTAQEAPAQGFTVRITEGYRDVSAEVLTVVSAGLTAFERTRAIEKKIKEISLAAEAAQPGLRAEVSEMFPGRTYVLFLYTYLRDVRLVYAPPQSVGNFGGETDNWMWPRHTGDFSFMRAYVGPDGQPAAYAPENVPFRPKQFLEISRQGVQDGDFVFIFGYPGSTHRHESSHYLEYQTEVELPMRAEWYDWQIRQLQILSAEDDERRLKLAPRIKSLSNSFKNYRGRLQGVARLDLVAARKRQEGALQDFIAADPRRQARFGELLAQLADFYQRRRETAAGDTWLGFFLRSPQILQAALLVWDFSREQEKPETERETAFMARNLERTRHRLTVMAESFCPAADSLIMSELLARAGDFPQVADIPVLADLVGQEGRAAAASLLSDALARTRFLDAENLERVWGLPAAELAVEQDPFLQLAGALYPTHKRLRDERKSRKGESDRLLAELHEVKQALLGTEFIPDANGTLRFTHGRIAGYSPRDAVRYDPLTTVAGLIEKATGSEPFILPARLQDLILAEDFGPFSSQELGGVPVNMLYSTDTTGGNSGSPVFNAQGKVVGINFDRPWEGTINDYTWDHRYSRSIGVDVRYVLWVTWKLGGGQALLKEMGIAVE
jgi:hypothetical protein